jgi:hypothetical protein
VNSSSIHTFDLTATRCLSDAEVPELVRTECELEQATEALRRRPAGTQPPPIAASSSPCAEPVTSGCGIAGSAAVNSAMQYAKEVHEELFEHRRGIWDCGDGISCLFDNDFEAHGALEIEMLRTLLAKAGCTEVELATYPLPGHEDGTYTLAMLVRGDAQTIFSVYETIDRELDRGSV